ncbi:MAG: redox-sensing transcriptional repressor Rex [Bacilli bacterium]
MEKKDLLSHNCITRLPLYLNYLKSLDYDDLTLVSTQSIATGLNINAEVVKKDIAAISSEKGMPRKGRSVVLLVKDLEKFLGAGCQINAVLIGTGHLGKALLNYDGFSEYGLNIIAAFDSDPRCREIDVCGINVYSMSLLDNIIKDKHAEIGIITVPSHAAQSVAEKLVQAGIKAIWNFAPINLNLDPSIIVANVNMASSLAVLSHQLYLNNLK